MTLLQAIRENALEEAQSKNWQQVANIVKAIYTTSEPRKCGSKESSLVVASVGGNPSLLLEKLRADATGELLFTRLADGSSEGGVIWAEPLLTIPYLQSRVSDFGQQVINALIDLSSAKTYPFADVTPEDCASTYLAGADVLLSVNITGGVTRCSLQVIRDGVQIKMQSLTEGQGDVADQALLSAIETAIYTFLIEG